MCLSLVLFVPSLQAFVDLHHLNVSELLLPLNEYNNFNEFFYRRLKPGARVIADPHDPRVCVFVCVCVLVCVYMCLEARHSQPPSLAPSVSFSRSLVSFSRSTSGTSQ